MLGQTSRDDEMQRNDATIKQSRRDKMRQGARYNDEARQDATTQRRKDATTRQRQDKRDDKRRGAAQQRGVVTQQDRK